MIEPKDLQHIEKCLSNIIQSNFKISYTEEFRALLQFQGIIKLMIKHLEEPEVYNKIKKLCNPDNYGK